MPALKKAGMFYYVIVIYEEPNERYNYITKLKLIILYVLFGKSLKTEKLIRVL